MKPSDTEPFIDQVMSPLYLAFREKPDAALSTTYFAALADLDFDTVLASSRRAIQALTFFPKVAELRALAVGSPDEQALAAWSLVYRHRHAGGYRPIAFDDPRIHAAVTAMGGWQEIHLLGFRGTEDVDVAVKRKEFVTHFKGFLLRGAPANTPKALCADSRPDPLLGGPVAISAHTEPAAFPVEPETKALPPRAEVEAPPEFRRLLEEIANRAVPATPRRREVVDRPVTHPATAAQIEDRDRKAREWIARLNEATKS